MRGMSGSHARRLRLTEMTLQAERFPVVVPHVKTGLTPQRKTVIIEKD